MQTTCTNVCMCSNKMPRCAGYGALHNNNNYSYCFSCCKIHSFTVCKLPMSVSVRVFVRNVFGVQDWFAERACVCTGLESKCKIACSERCAGSHPPLYPWINAVAGHTHTHTEREDSVSMPHLCWEYETHYLPCHCFIWCCNYGISFHVVAHSMER